MPISQELIDILACPKCKGSLEQIEEPEGFACKGCNLLYKVEDDIPNFLIDEAVPWKK
ncbi:MAG: Trm112 family protein [Proteobacteria bacterium]|nr:Trm112 family protein [Pseudomonadota bacterium]